MWVNDLPDLLRTGDVILFSAHADDRGANIIKFATRTKWNHVGIVYRPEPHRCMMFDWTGGLHVYNLVDILRQDVYESGAWQEVAVRQLMVGDGVDRGALEDAMEDWIFELIQSVGRSKYVVDDESGKGQVEVEAELGDGIGNKSFPIGEAIGAFIDQLTSSLLPCVSHGRSDKPKEDNLRSLFCSKFVALCFKSVGLIGPGRNVSHFTPRSFAPEGDSFLDLQNGASLGPLMAVSFEPVVARNAMLDLLSLANHSVVTVTLGREATATTMERSAALMLQHWYRGFLMRREARLIARQRHYEHLYRQAVHGSCLGAAIEKCTPQKMDLSGTRNKRIAAKVSELKARTSEAKWTKSTPPIQNDPRLLGS